MRTWGSAIFGFPTWAPFRLQFYFNGHNLLALQLKRKGIGYRVVDNVFVGIEEFTLAQKLADSLRVDALHRTLDRIAHWIGRTYKYYVTRLGQRILTVALKLRCLFLIPAIAEGSAA